MITAEEFFRNKIKEETHLKEPITLSQTILNAEQTMRWAQEYSVLKAKYHVEKALLEAIREAPYHCEEGVLNCYPSSNIK
jgi:hypothetical protein